MEGKDPLAKQVGQPLGTRSGRDKGKEGEINKERNIKHNLTQGSVFKLETRTTRTPTETRKNLVSQSGACHKISSSSQVTTDLRNHHQGSKIHYVHDRSCHNILYLKFFYCYTTNRTQIYESQTIYLIFHIYYSVFLLSLIHIDVTGRCGWDVCVMSSEESALSCAI